MMALPKTIIIDDSEFTPGYPVCAGCPHLTLSNGWSCFFEPGTEKCAYPDKFLAAITEMAQADEQEISRPPGIDKWMELDEQLPTNEKYIDVMYGDGTSELGVRPVSVDLMEVEFWKPSA